MFGQWMSSTFSKIALFIDGPNLYATAKTLGFDIDDKRMPGEVQSRGALLRAFHLDPNQQRSTAMRKRAICPLVAPEFGFCLAAAPESGDVKLLGKRIGAVEACEEAEDLLRGLSSPYSSQA